MDDGDYAGRPRVRIGDREYRALPTGKERDYVGLGLGRSEGPEPGFTWSEKALLYVADVHLSEVDAFYPTRWLFTWRGKWFVLDKVENGLLFGTLRAGNDAWARENGLTVIDRGWAAGQFSQDEVENLHEEVTDYLAEPAQDRQAW